MRNFILRSFGIEEIPTRRGKRPLPIFAKKIWVLWDTPVTAPCEARRPDLLVHLIENKEIWIVEGAVCLDWKIYERQKEKYVKYLELQAHLETINAGWKIKIIPLVLGVFGAYSHTLEEKIKESDRRGENPKSIDKSIEMRHT